LLPRRCEDQINDAVEKNVMAEVKKAFNPEFLNRLDETSSSSRSRCDLIQIVELCTELECQPGAEVITISVTEEAKK